jgi:hypothetical protein
MLTVEEEKDEYVVQLLLSPGWRVEKCFYLSSEPATKDGNTYRFSKDAQAFKFRITNGKRYELILTKDEFVIRKAK